MPLPIKCKKCANESHCKRAIKYNTAGVECNKFAPQPVSAPEPTELAMIPFKKCADCPIKDGWIKKYANVFVRAFQSAVETQTRKNLERVFAELDKTTNQSGVPYECFVGIRDKYLKRSM